MKEASSLCCVQCHDGRGIIFSISRTKLVTYEPHHTLRLLLRYKSSSIQIYIELLPASPDVDTRLGAPSLQSRRLDGKLLPNTLEDAKKSALFFHITHQVKSPVLHLLVDKHSEVG